MTFSSGGWNEFEADLESILVAGLECNLSDWWFLWRYAKLDRLRIDF